MFKLFKTTLLCALALCAAGSTQAQVPVPSGTDPDHRNVTALPGDGIAINSVGDIDGNGAIQLNIPVAYIPTPGNVLVGAFFGGTGSKDTTLNNKTVCAGTTIPGTNDVYVSLTQLGNEIGAMDINAQVQLLPEKSNSPAISVGVADIFAHELNSRSFYAVGTKTFQVDSKTIYGTLGVGTDRFKTGLFGGASMPISDYFNGAIEWDGFQLNTAVAYRPGGRYGRLTGIAGYNGREGFILGASTIISLK